MPDQPDPRDPVAYLPWRCELTARVGQILVAIVDDAVRPLVLRNTARRLNAPYLTCEPVRSGRQFLELLARGLGLRIPRGRHDLYDAVRERLKQEPRLVFLDSAEHLTRTALEIMLDFHKEDEHLRREVSFVLGSGQRRLLERIDAVDCEGSFTSHCTYYLHACEPTKKMQQKWENLQAALRPPIPFPGTADDPAVTDTSAGDRRGR